jgi:putative PIN family toxin of toxin-antitoxin system
LNAEANGAPTPAGGTSVVLDTNIVLDVFVFNDPAAVPVRQALADKTLDWLAAQPMRYELARVLAYPKIAVRLAFYKLNADDVLAKFDQYARLVDVAPKASVTCSDADDQKFIDLAVQHRTLLLSKDAHVLSMRKRLLALGIHARAAM